LRFMEIGFRLHDTMIYAKDSMPPLNHRRYEQEFEYSFVFSIGEIATFNPTRIECSNAGVPNRMTTRQETCGDLKKANRFGQPVKDTKIRGNIWRYPVNGSADVFAHDHPAVFPMSLARDHILSWSNEGDAVLDCFSGSGTTMKMARETGRHGIGIEINADYNSIAKKRLSQRTLFAAETTKSNEGKDKCVSHS